MCGRDQTGDTHLLWCRAVAQLLPGRDSTLEVGGPAPRDPSVGTAAATKRCKAGLTTRHSWPIFNAGTRPSWHHRHSVARLTRKYAAASATVNSASPPLPGSTETRVLTDDDWIGNVMGRGPQPTASRKNQQKRASYVAVYGIGRPHSRPDRPLCHQQKYPADSTVVLSAGSGTTCSRPNQAYSSSRITPCRNATATASDRVRTPSLR